jgi:hypothetical protein
LIIIIARLLQVGGEFFPDCRLDRQQNLSALRIGNTAKRLAKMRQAQAVGNLIGCPQLFIVKVLTEDLDILHLRIG